MFGKELKTTRPGVVHPRYHGARRSRHPLLPNALRLCLHLNKKVTPPVARCIN